MVYIPTTPENQGHGQQAPCKHWQRTGWLFILLLLAAYLAFFTPCLSNVPQGDDLSSILPFVQHWHEASAADRISALFSQYFSHRIVLTKLTAIAVDHIEGHLNLVVMQAMGLALWSALALYGVWYCANRTKNVWLALPVALLLLNPKGMTNVLIAMQSVSNIGIFVLAVLATTLVVRASPVLFSIALLSSAVAIFTLANGLVLPPLLTLLLILKKDYRRATVCFVIGTTATACYFRGFEPPESVSFSLSEFTANVAMMIGGPLRLDRLQTHVTELIGGALLTAAAATLFRHRKHLLAEPLAMFILFLLGSIILTAYGRLGWGSEYMLQDRYSPYGLLLAACTWGLNITPNTRTAVSMPAIAAAALVSFCAYVSACPTLVENDRTAQAIIINQQLGVNISRDEWSKNAANQAQAIASNVLRMPAPSATTPSSMVVGTLARQAESTRSTQKFLLTRDPARAAYSLIPAAGYSPEPTEYCLLLTYAHVYILPGACVRAPYLSAFLHLDPILHDRAVYIWPTNNPSDNPVAIVGIQRTKANRWSITWRGDL